MRTFASLPDTARLWIFPLESTLDPRAEPTLQQSLSSFVSGWKAHGAEVVGGFELRYDRFVVVGADSTAAEVSGCSIDSLFRKVESAVLALDLPLAPTSAVFYRNGSEMTCTSRPEFRQLIQSGAVTLATTVFDNTIQNLGKYRSGEWEIPLARSWHARAFAEDLARLSAVDS